MGMDMCGDPGKDKRRHSLGFNSNNMNYSSRVRDCEAEGFGWVDGKNGSGHCFGHL